MQQFMAFFTALFLMINGFFAALPHTVPVALSKPGTTVSDTEKVLKVYKDIAAKNNDLQTRTTVKGEYPNFSWLESLRAKFTTQILNPIGTGVGHVMLGVPSSYSAMKASDLKSAKAEYYNNGKTVVITLSPKLESFTEATKTPAPIATRAFGPLVDGIVTGLELSQTMFGATSYKGEFQVAEIKLVADAKTGKIVSADFNLELLVAYKNNGLTLMEILYVVETKLP